MTNMSRHDVCNTKEIEQITSPETLGFRRKIGGMTYFVKMLFKQDEQETLQ